MTEIKGRTLILICVTLAATIGFSGAWFRVSMTNDSAKFWGPVGARLITGNSHVELLELEPLDEESQSAAEETEADDQQDDAQETLAAGIRITKRHDLTGKPGMVHFRNAMTLDQSFQWNKQHRTTLADSQNQWRWALVFSGGDQRLVVLLDKHFNQWGRLEEDAEEALGEAQGEILATPAQYLNKMTAEYFEEIGIIDKPDEE